MISPDGATSATPSEVARHQDWRFYDDLHHRMEFFKNAFGIQFGFKALESTVNGLAFLQSHSSHAMFLVGLVVPQVGRGGVDAGSAVACQDRTRR
jgi:hypothetical protein